MLLRLIEFEGWWLVYRIDNGVCIVVAVIFLFCFIHYVYA